MDMQSQSPLLSQKVARIGANVLTDFLKIPVRAQTAAPPLVEHGAEIQISGQWKGNVTVSACDRLSHRIACQMFKKTDETLDSADILDAMAEVTNIIAGNIKAILPGPSHLSLPHALDTLPGEHRSAVDVQLFDDQAGMLRICLQAATH